MHLFLQISAPLVVLKLQLKNIACGGNFNVGFYNCNGVKYNLTKLTTRS